METTANHTSPASPGSSVTKTTNNTHNTDITHISNDETKSAPRPLSPREANSLIAGSLPARLPVDEPQSSTDSTLYTINKAASPVSPSPAALNPNDDITPTEDSSSFTNKPLFSNPSPGLPTTDHNTPAADALPEVNSVTPAENTEKPPSANTGAVLAENTEAPPAVKAEIALTENIHPMVAENAETTTTHKAEASAENAETMSTDNVAIIPVGNACPESVETDSQTVTASQETATKHKASLAETKLSNQPPDADGSVPPPLLPTVPAPTDILSNTKDEPVQTFNVMSAVSALPVTQTPSVSSEGENSPNTSSGGLSDAASHKENINLSPNKLKIVLHPVKLRPSDHAKYDDTEIVYNKKSDSAWPEPYIPTDDEKVSTFRLATDQLTHRLTHWLTGRPTDSIGKLANWLLFVCHLYFSFD